MVDGAAWIEELAAIGEAVGRNIENAHEQRAATQDQHFLAKANAENFASDQGGESLAWAEVEKTALVEVKVADGFACRSVLSFFHGFFEFFREDIFLVGFLEPGIAELVFALAILFGEDACGIGQIDVGTGLGWSFMRKDHTENGINGELGLTAGARNLQRVGIVLRHKHILRLFANNGAAQGPWVTASLRDISGEPECPCRSSALLWPVRSLSPVADRGRLRPGRAAGARRNRDRRRDFRRSIRRRCQCSRNRSRAR